MPNKGLRRIQLTLLLIVAGLIIWRMNASPAGQGFVSISGMDTRELKSAHFDVLRPVSVQIEGEVSFEDDRAGSDLAVLAWILDRSTGEVVWRTRVENVTRESVRALVSDSVALDPGPYSAFFSTYGPDDASYKDNSAFGLKPHWTNYESYWHLDLMAPDGAVDQTDPPMENVAANGALFEMGLLERRTSSTKMIHVEGTSVVRVEGGFTRCASRCDSIVIKEIPSGTVVWSIDEVEAEPAGGSRINHHADADVTLPGGVYEIAFEPGSHRGRWSENPPWNPDAFVFTLYAGSEGRLRPLDPWAFGQPLVDQLGLGDSELAETRLVTEDSLDIILFALGEINSPTSRYDWGWIEREDTGEMIWEMTYEDTVRGGGDEDNRAAKAILSLAPGSYLVTFRTDGSHSYAGFNRSRPTHPERWVLAVFPLDPDGVDTSRVRVENVAREAPTPDAPSGSSLTGIDASRFLVNMTSLGNDQDVSTEFTLTESTDVVLMALGEVTSSSEYDYGWLENVSSGGEVWRMRWDTTSPAGGDDSYRQARVELTLAPATYRAHFRTDGSISYEGYGSDVPDNPEDWGMAIFLAR